MISGMDTALRHIKDNIPHQIIKLIFSGGLSLDERLKEDVIYRTVIPDCNLKGGKVLQIPLEMAWDKSPPGQAFSLFEIPEVAREGRNIIEVHSIELKDRASDGGYGGYVGYGGSAGGSSPSTCGASGCQGHGNFANSDSMIYATNSMIQSKVLNMSQGNPIPEIMGNMVKLHPSPGSFVPWVLTCRVCYDQEMTNLNSAAIEKFADIAVVATKRYCYNKMIMGLDAGAIEFGTELPVLKDIISQWGDLKDMYNEACSSFATATKLDIRRFEALARSMM